MISSNRHKLSEREIWSAIQYLDPDLEDTPDNTRNAAAGKEKVRSLPLTIALVSIFTLIVIVALRFFHVISRLTNN